MKACNGVMDVGRQLDNLATVIEFPIADVLSEYGDGGSWSVRIQRNGDVAAYPTNQFTVGDGKLNLTMRREDMAKLGEGQIQLRYAVGDIVKMSRVFKYYSHYSLDATEEVPEPWVAWVEEVEANADRAEAAVVHYPRINEENLHWMVWNAETEEWVDTGVAARGEADHIEWGNVTNKPETFPPSVHNHDSRYYTKTEVDTKVPTKTSDLNNDSGFITKDANNLTHYYKKAEVDEAVSSEDAAVKSWVNNKGFSVISETGYRVDLECDPDTYELKAKLYDKNNVLLSTSTVIDLPIESLIVSITYDSSTKELVITLKSGSVTRVPIGAIVSGLATQTWVENYAYAKSDVYTKTESNEKFVEKETGKGLSTNDYTTTEKTKLAGLENYDDTEVKEAISDLDNDKVDKDGDKVLSTNDYSNEEKQKVAGNTTARHTHSNKSILDTITQAMLELIGTISGKYVKPTAGIPKTDLANDVQSSLDKADSALQEHQSLAAYRTSADQDLIDASLQEKNDDSLLTDDKTVVGAINENKGRIDDEVEARSEAVDILQDEIDNLKAIGRFLSIWDCTTGLPTTNPQTSPYAYKTGDYYLVGVVGATNYKPNGSSFTIGVASTTVETEDVTVSDYYAYDGAVWKLLKNTQKVLSFANITGNPSDNQALNTALGGKISKVVNPTANNVPQLNADGSINNGVGILTTAEVDAIWEEN